MAGTPTAEVPPKGLDGYWTNVWRHALKVMKEQGTWAWEHKPLLDEYVYALRAAEATRNGFEWLDALETYAENADELPDIAWTVLREIAGSLPTQWDRHVKRAEKLAQTLALTVEGQKRHGASDVETPADPLSALDELAERRRRGSV